MTGRRFCPVKATEEVRPVNTDPRGSQDTPEFPNDADRERGRRAAVELPTTANLCRQCLNLTDVQGAAVTVLNSASSRELMYATDSVAQHLDELQFTGGDGPCVDAFTTQRPTFCNDTSSDYDRDIWPGFASEAGKAGVGSVFAFPLKGGNDVFGVLELYRLAPLPLDEEQVELATATAAAIAVALLAELPLIGDFDTGTLVNAFHRPEVNQAVGMIAIQLRVSIDESLSRLRAAAYSSGRPIWEIAADIVNRRTRFTHGSENG
ncbi:GAF and ANTAR domain-containing protein [Rhodococcus sp. OAS809]|uniref:GAF and ANTAR domain-containing protein n=1 Tax=Rhodococcus sp. OAS809 TaxID=2663874 RepID=UPI0033974965